MYLIVLICKRQLIKLVKIIYAKIHINDFYTHKCILYTNIANEFQLKYKMYLKLNILNGLPYKDKCIYKSFANINM